MRDGFLSGCAPSEWQGRVGLRETRSGNQPQAGGESQFTKSVVIRSLQKQNVKLNILINFQQKIKQVFIGLQIKFFSQPVPGHIHTLRVLKGNGCNIFR